MLRMSAHGLRFEHGPLRIERSRSASNGWLAFHAAPLGPQIGYYLKAKDGKKPIRFRTPIEAATAAFEVWGATTP